MIDLLIKKKKQTYKMDIRREYNYKEGTIRGSFPSHLLTTAQNEEKDSSLGLCAFC